MSKIAKIYACGGAGTNVALGLEKYQGIETGGLCTLDINYIDTSRSNLRDGIDGSRVYVLDGKDGAGKKRDTHYNAIYERRNEILLDHKPGDINIILHSCSGGSGSVIGPVLVSELLDRKEPVIVLMIGTSDSRIETENTAKTLKSYESISKNREVPVIACYNENSQDTPRGAVDVQIRTAALVLAAIFSGQNAELDSSDLYNFLNYNKVTSFKPRLAKLDFFSGKVELPKDQSLVTLVTLAKPGDDTTSTIPVEHQSVGFTSREALEVISIDMPIHAAIISGAFNEVLESLEKKIASNDEVRRSRVEKSIIGHNDSAQLDGLVL